MRWGKSGLLGRSVLNWVYKVSREKKSKKQVQQMQLNFLTNYPKFYFYKKKIFQIFVNRPTSKEKREKRKE